MARIPRRMLALLLLVLFTTPFVTAQAITSVPDLSTATQTTESSDTESTATSAETTAESTGDATTTGDSTAATSDATTTGDTTAESTGDSTAASSFATTDSTATTTGGNAPFVSDVPTIAGAGIPTMVVPYTADAPFMQHSDLPEGTVFIVVGAVLAFLGACVLFWRLLVAWSINRSVRRSAMAAIRSSEKAGTPWGGNGGYNPIHKETGSVMSLDALNSNGKPLKSHFKDEPSRGAPPPANLFFSPTAQARNDNGPRPVSDVMNNRSSTYLPAGYYASTSAHPAGGAGATTMGGTLAPYARHSTLGLGQSPPSSPGLQPQSRNSGGYRATSRDGGLRAQSRDGLASGRNSYLDVSSSRPGHHSGIYSQPSSSSLMVGGGNNSRSEENLPGSRAPSAYLEDLFENHGHGPRERF